MLEVMRYGMLKVKIGWKSFSKNQRGQSMTEYALILALVAVITIGTWKLFGPEIVNMLNTVINALKDAQK